jgi:hypothetical protein
VSNPEEFITYDPSTEQVIRWDNLDSAEGFFWDVEPDLFIQEVETDDMDQTFNVYGSD